MPHSRLVVEPSIFHRFVRLNKLQWSLDISGPNGYLMVLDVLALDEPGIFVSTQLVQGSCSWCATFVQAVRTWLQDYSGNSVSPLARVGHSSQWPISGTDSRDKA